MDYLFRARSMRRRLCNRNYPTAVFVAFFGRRNRVDLLCLKQNVEPGAVTIALPVQLLLGRLDNLFAYYICDTLKLRLEAGHRYTVRFVLEASHLFYGMPNGDTGHFEFLVAPATFY